MKKIEYGERGEEEEEETWWNEKEKIYNKWREIGRKLRRKIRIRLKYPGRWRRKTEKRMKEQKKDWYFEVGIDSCNRMIIIIWKMDTKNKNEALQLKTKKK